MPKLPRISAKEAIHALERLGFKQIRQKGSHLILTKMTDEGKIGCVIPMHKELAVGTLTRILKQAKLTREDFIDKL